jgi:hypothetical protein
MQILGTTQKLQKMVHQCLIQNKGTSRILHNIGVSGIATNKRYITKYAPECM